MINPIKIVINNLAAIKIYIQDFPRSFNACFTVNNYLHITSKISALIKIIPQISVKLKNVMKIGLGIGIKPINYILLDSAIQFKNLIRLFCKSEIGETNSAKFNTKIRTFIRITPEIRVALTNNIITKTMLRIKQVQHNVGLKSSVKIIIAIFYKHHERGYMTWEQVENNESSRTWQTFLTREI